MNLRLIVTGGRKYGEIDPHAPHSGQDRARVFREISGLTEYLDLVHAKRVISCIIQGDCPTGTDRHARNWAGKNGVMVERWPADWAKEKKKAGPLRNTRMVEGSDAHGCVATEGGPGTADCVRKCVGAGITVKKVEPKK